MKKWLILLGVIGLLGCAWYYLRTYVRYDPEWTQAKFGEIARGDIRVPISASGLIEAERRITIKPEASGQILRIRVVEGDFVKKGDILVEIKKDDEQRRLAQARSALIRAQAMLAQSQVAVERARQNILSAQASVEEIQGNGELIDIDLKWEHHLLDIGSGTQKAVDTLEARKKVNNARLKSAEASLAIARASLKDAEQTVIIQQAAVEEATKQVEDAAQRLSETTIVAPQDAIVTEVHVSEGMVVQSATQGFTGGTPVMTLADISSLKVIARVDESDIGRVWRISPIDALPEIAGLREAAAKDAESLKTRTGKVKLTVDAFPEETFKGQIVRAEPQGKLNAGAAVIQFNVHVKVTDSRWQELPLGTQAQVEFTVESVKDALLVPAEAVMTHEDQRGIWIKTPPAPGSREKFGKQFVPCRFGITDGAVTHLAGVLGEHEPLKEGQQIITKLPKEREQE